MQASRAKKIFSQIEDAKSGGFHFSGKVVRRIAQNSIFFMDSRKHHHWKYTCNKAME